MSNCRFCDEPVWHRRGWDEYGETTEYQLRVPTCGPSSDVCEPSPTGFHLTDRPHWTTTARIVWGEQLYDLVELARDYLTGQPVTARRAVVRLYSVYPMMPKGTSDPAYIANVIRAEFERTSGLANGEWIEPGAGGVVVEVMGYGGEVIDSRTFDEPIHVATRVVSR